MRQPGHVEADVVVDADDDAEQHEGPLRQRVRGEPPGRRRREDADCDELVRMKVLRHPAVRRTVVMVDRVDMAVEKADLVVYVVPNEVLGVEDGQRGVLLPTEGPDAGRHRRRLQWRRPHVLRDGDRKQEENVIPEGQRDGIADRFRRHLPIRLDLVLLDPFPVGAVQVDDGERDHRGEVEEDG